MPQCLQCGSEVDEAAQFCARCGAPLGQISAPAPAPAPTRWHKGRHVVLAFLGAIVVIGLIFVVGVIYFIRHTTIVTSTKNGGRMESPFGVVTTNNDPAKLAKTLGLDIFPGAVGEKGAQAELAQNNMVSLTFRTAAAPRAVINYYHVRYPDATVGRQGEQLSLVLVSLRDTLTIKARPASGHTEIEVSDIRH